MHPVLVPKFKMSIELHPCGWYISNTSHTIFSAVSDSRGGPKVKNMAGNTECGLPARLAFATEAT